MPFCNLFLKRPSYLRNHGHNTALTKPLLGKTTRYPTQTSLISCCHA